MIDTSEKSTLRTISALVRAHTDPDPRLRGLASKADELADQAADEIAASRVAKSADGPDAQASQLAYLREHSPSAASAYERGRVA